MAESFAQFMIDKLGAMPPELIIFIISMIPILELRGGLIAAALLKIPVLRALPICIIGNIIPVPFILLLVTPIFSWLKQTSLFRPMVEKLEARAMGKSDQIAKAEFWGLLLFVGIPLPGTGAWTGGLIASVLDIKPKKKAFVAEILGIFLASAIMCIATYFIPWIISGVF